MASTLQFDHLKYVYYVNFYFIPAAAVRTTITRQQQIYVYIKIGEEETRTNLFNQYTRFYITINVV